MKLIFLLVAFVAATITISAQPKSGHLHYELIDFYQIMPKDWSKIKKPGYKLISCEELKAKG